MLHCRGLINSCEPKIISEDANIKKEERSAYLEVSNKVQKNALADTTVTGSCFSRIKYMGRCKHTGYFPCLITCL